MTKQEEKLTQKEDELRNVVEKLDVQTKECQEVEKKFRQVSRRARRMMFTVFGGSFS